MKAAKTRKGVEKAIGQTGSESAQPSNQSAAPVVVGMGKPTQGCRLSPEDIDVRIGLPSASSLDREMNCPGSVALCKHSANKLQSLSSAAAERGTRIHKADETGDLSQVDNQHERDLVRRIRQAQEAIYNQWKEEFNLDGITIVREKRFWLKEKGARVFSAQVDFLATGHPQGDPNSIYCLLLDTKSGTRDVQPVATNWQLRSGLVLASLQLSSGLSKNPVVAGRVGIVQPMGQKQPVCDYDSTDILFAWVKLLDHLEKREDPKHPRKAGDWCAYCPANRICEEGIAVIVELDKLKALQWGNVKPEEKLRLFRICRTAENIIKNIKAGIRSDLDADPNSITGLAKRADSTPRSVANNAAVIQALLDLGLVNINDCLKIAKVSIADLIGFLADHPQFKYSDDQIDNFLDGLEKSEVIVRGKKSGAIYETKQP